MSNYGNVFKRGDHAYNEGESDEKRGDGYMSAWQRALSNCTWAPVVGTPSGSDYDCLVVWILFSVENLHIHCIMFVI